MITSPKNGPLFIRILGRLFQVTGIAESVDEANQVCFNDRSQSVIDSMGDLHILARHDDKGIPTAPHSVLVELTTARMERDLLAARLEEMTAAYDQLFAEAAAKA